MVFVGEAETASDNLRLTRSSSNTPDRLVGPLGMAVRLGRGDAFAGYGLKRGWLVGL
jgi:hypothetical protein